MGELRQLNRTYLTPDCDSDTIKVDISREQHCPACNKLLFKGKWTGAIEIKCKKCKLLSKIRAI